MNLIQIGRFSRVTRLSVKALRRYADEGLLVPAHIDASSGYRYYTYEQARDAELIRVLRSLDVPLSDIQRALQATDRQSFLTILSEHELRIQSELAHQQRMLGFLRQLINNEGVLMPYDISIKQTPAHFAAVVRADATAATMADTVGAGFAAAAAAIQASGAAFAGPPFFSMATPPDDEPAEIEVGFPVATAFTDRDGVIGVEVPAMVVAAAIHRGPYDQAGPVYQAIEAWIQAHGHAGVGAPREVYLNSPGDTTNPEDYLTEIQFPISTPA
ncbi:MAG TPA: GyrI-like domain-containing protein [Propionicimonas sp.]|jgi:DNA-binding transcriptional MerR regulator|nr:GyrI-like domain-containing protein [Propionicimonas sp.]